MFISARLFQYFFVYLLWLHFSLKDQAYQSVCNCLERCIMNNSCYAKYLSHKCQKKLLLYNVLYDICLNMWSKLSYINDIKHKILGYLWNHKLFIFIKIILCLLKIVLLTITINIIYFLTEQDLRDRKSVV